MVIAIIGCAGNKEVVSSSNEEQANEQPAEEVQPENSDSDTTQTKVAKPKPQLIQKHAKKETHIRLQNP